MEFEQGPSYAIYTMLSSLYTPGKVQELLKSMETPPKINAFKSFSLCCSGPDFGFSGNLFLFQQPPTDFAVQKKFPELLDAKYASFGGKKYK